MRFGKRNGVPIHAIFAKEVGLLIHAKIVDAQAHQIFAPGSIPAIPFLEKFFGATAVHIPIGQVRDTLYYDVLIFWTYLVAPCQASDSAHLPNERIRLQNLMVGRKVFKSFLEEVAAPRPSRKADQWVRVRLATKYFQNTIFAKYNCSM
jgi:hypothetical protein